MAEKKEKTEAYKTESQHSVKPSESVYTVQELAAGAGKLFGVTAECVTAAFKEAGKRDATLSRAKEIVNAFMRKEIR